MRSLHPQAVVRQEIWWQVNQQLLDQVHGFLVMGWVFDDTARQVLNQSHYPVFYLVWEQVEVQNREDTTA